MKNKYGESYESFSDKLSKNGEIESSSYYRDQKNVQRI